VSRALSLAAEPLARLLPRVCIRPTAREHSDIGITSHIISVFPVLKIWETKQYWLITTLQEPAPRML
jgi:hypothetical protein